VQILLAFLSRQSACETGSGELDQIVDVNGINAGSAIAAGGDDYGGFWCIKITDDLKPSRE
jgi:hypothetical protein